MRIVLILGQRDILQALLKLVDLAWGFVDYISGPLIVSSASRRFHHIAKESPLIVMGIIFKYSRPFLNAP